MTTLIDPALHGKPHVRPCGAGMVVLRSLVDAAAERNSPGGVLIPDVVDNEAQDFEVVGLHESPGHTFEVGLGDRVLVCPWMLTTVILETGEFWLCHERDILARFEPEPV